MTVKSCRHSTTVIHGSTPTTGPRIDLCPIPLRDARILLRNRLTGSARIWIEGMPLDLGMEELMERFRQRFGTGDS